MSLLVAVNEVFVLLFYRKGKRAVGDSDSDDSSDEEEDEESVVLNNGCQVVLDKGTGESSGSVMDGGKASSGSGSEEEKDVVVNQSSDVPKGEMTGVQVVNEEKMDDSSVTVVDGVVQTEKENTVEAASEALVSSVPAENQGNDSEVKTVGAAGDTESVDAAMCCKPEEPLNFDDFNSAKDMEVCKWVHSSHIQKPNQNHYKIFILLCFFFWFQVMGMERLKTELQSRGLKCGGTLQERAARLFLLKSTPIDKLPKKLLAKK